jgi:hypothetical protein
MRTIDDPVSPVFSRSSQLVRDGRVIARLGKLLIAYALTGGRVRRRYRHKQRRGEIFFVDEELRQ